MKAYLYDAQGGRTLLPELLSWDVCHGLGETSDFFELCFPYSEGMLGTLSGAVRFKLSHKGESVFYGVVDEYTVKLDETGLTASVSGRSLQALLLDNEAESASYAAVSMQTLLSKHVYPHGLTDVKLRQMPALSSFTVSSGESEWSVLSRFCRYSCGIQPYFSRSGILILDEPSGAIGEISSKCAVLSERLYDERYGIISEVTVKNYVRGTSLPVRNESFIARGGSCRRVLSVPRSTTAEAMRYTGEYQIRESEKGRRYLELEVPELFSAFPGDVLTLKADRIGISGAHRVLQSRCYGSDGGFGTVLRLEV